MELFNVHSAKTHLSRLIERAVAGEEIVIARNNEPAVRLVPIGAIQPRKQFGSMKGLVELGSGFFDSLPQQELDAWET